MRLLISAATLAVALLAACSPRDASAPASNSTATNATASKTNAATQPEVATGDDVARIKQDELSAALQRGAVVLYDVRDKASYEAGHIRGAKNVPWDEVEKRLSEFPKDKRIVTYCA
jgi:3-mercaptopyruvate sulfurtransferase SseA